MLAENVESGLEVIKPMYMDALKRLSFGIKIIRVDVGLMLGQAPQGMMPMVGCFYTAKSNLIGDDKDPTQITMVPLYVKDQKVVDEFIQQGCEALRQAIASQSVIGNGQGIDLTNMDFRKDQQ